PALAPVGLGPDLGAGNVTETAAKLELLAGEGAEARLVMHHAAQRYAFPDFASLGGGEQEEPPWTAEVRAGGRTLPHERGRERFDAPRPRPSAHDARDLTAAS